MYDRIVSLLICVGVFFCFYHASPVKAQETPQNYFEVKDWQEVFSFDFRNLTYAKLRYPVDSIINSNNQRHINRIALISEFRPDVSARMQLFELLVKPRWEASWEQCRDGTCADQEETQESGYISEWRVRLEPMEGLFLSYGMEDLQWGPSFLLSPSNPFFTENGRSQPKQEVDSAEYARMVWLVDEKWTWSFIALTGNGRKEMFPGEVFNKGYALKVDHSASNGYGSLVFAKTESGDYRGGFNASWNLDDSTLLYMEGSYSRQAEILTGASYTFLNGGMFALEYFYNGYGNDTPIVTRLVDGDLPSSRQLLFRRNYLMAQYVYQDIIEEWEVLLRATMNLDDKSMVLLGAHEYVLSDHVRFFANGSLYKGDSDEEFGLLYKYQVMTGLEIVF